MPKLNIYLVFLVLFSILSSLNLWSRETNVSMNHTQMLYDAFEATSNRNYIDTRGIEVEGFIERSIGQEGVVEMIRKKVNNSLGVKANIELERHEARGALGKTTIMKYALSYDHLGRNHKYTIVPDFSVQPTKAYYPVELASPILASQEDRKSFFDVIERLKNAGYKTNSHMAGVHVHIGVSNISIAEVQLIAKIFSNIEKDIIDWSSLSKKRQKYAQQTSDRMYKILNNDFYTHEQLKLDSKELQSKLRMLNLVPLNQIGTIEFRFLNGTTDAFVIKAYADFAAALVRAVRTKSPELKSLVSKNSYSFFEIIEAIGLERKRFEEASKRIKDATKRDVVEANKKGFVRRIVSALDFMGYFYNSKKNLNFKLKEYQSNVTVPGKCKSLFAN